MSDQEHVGPPPPPSTGQPAAGTPPPSPPPQPPSGSPPPTREPLPWEVRGTLGFGKALLESVRLFVTAPREAFDRARRKGDVGSPLLWLVIIGVFNGILQWIWSMAFTAPYLAFMPESVRDEIGPFLVAMTAGGGLLNLIYVPVVTLIGVSIAALILHVCLLLVGGLSSSEAGFEGTFRASSYAYVAQIAQIVPVFGALVALVWNVVLVVIGVTSLHRTSTGKAVVAVLIPTLLCCVCFSMALTIGLAALMGAAGFDQ